MSNALSFSRQESDAGTTCFLLSGSIDVHALPVLESLLSLDLAEHLILDFATVQRVNSMGLAQLLKIFETLTRRGISVEIRNPNRMISMLFKMTGMQAYLEGAQKHAVPPALLQAERPLAAAPTPLVPAPPVSLEAEQSRLHFRVSLQSSQQLSGWYFFNTYLQRVLERAVRFEPVHGALGAHPVATPVRPDLVYAKPFDACQLILEQGYLAVARPEADTDEVSIVVRADDPRDAVSGFEGARIATATANSFVYLLGRFLLDESGMDSGACHYVFAGQEMKALQLLLNGDVDMLFMLSDNYKNLSGLTRSATRLLDESDSCFAFHLLCLAPEYHALQPRLENMLMTMKDLERGQQVLQDMHIAGWSMPAQEEMAMLIQLYTRYRDVPVASDDSEVISFSHSRHV